MNATSKKIAAATLFIGFITTTEVCSHDCPPGVGAEPSANPDVRQVNTLPVVNQAGTLPVRKLYQLFHNPLLNQSDGLGDYVHDFHADAAGQGERSEGR
jgi:hypothetical protein